MSDMLVPLYKLPEYKALPDTLQEQSIEIRRAIAPEKHKVLRWVRQHFNEGWADECETAFARVPVSIYLAIEKGELIGFGCYDATCRGFFGPTGVSEQARGKGAGKALLLACLSAMRNDGYGYAIIGGAGPVDFYKKAAGAIEIPDSVPGIYKGML
ncbi:GNAT family N-acetyltransferase [Paenibacillus protaetiae]|uniref:GNAT family N-acetyltransferase n=1 Tax=Paenibacillus protaetiae TaxID=2509456 RepID=A0A4V0YF87_9BACL|nr:GNAT family N-acetyltransferase [Paenibacillus protaetiae]QAY66851.1 GNAT family N-acetyltransferase [Paenibacillus protaetiae]